MQGPPLAWYAAPTVNSVTICNGQQGTVTVVDASPNVQKQFTTSQRLHPHRGAVANDFSIGEPELALHRSERRGPARSTTATTGGSPRRLSWAVRASAGACGPSTGSNHPVPVPRLTIQAGAHAGTYALTITGTGAAPPIRRPSRSPSSALGGAITTADSRWLAADEHRHHGQQHDGASGASSGIGGRTPTRGQRWPSVHGPTGQASPLWYRMTAPTPSLRLGFGDPEDNTSGTRRRPSPGSVPPMALGPGRRAVTAGDNTP